MPKLKNLYLIVGKSGSGKTSIAEYFHKTEGLIQAESYTDRKPRFDGEIGHHFVSKEEFDKLEGKLLLVDFSDYRYAMTKELIDNADFMVLEPSGIKELKATYTNRNIFVIGLYCSEKKLIAHMKNRGDDDSDILKRISHDEDFFVGMEDVCDIMVNNSGDIENTQKMIKIFISGVEASS